MTHALAQPLANLVAKTLGLRLNNQEQTVLCRKILLQLNILGFSSPEAYYRCLLASGELAIAATEWQALVCLVTVSESYFFRDQGQFSLLRNNVLPELLKWKQGLDAEDRKTLRIWSAGCSTGEEAYSLAILIHELIPDAHAWNIVIVGTDINQAVLDQAKSGIYPEWSFRSIDPTIWQKYFRQHRRDWQIDPDIRRMVTFKLGNLVQDNYPSFNSGMYDFDLILCRNVFIYFDADTIAHVLNKFYQTLAPQGYLITGHAELYGQNTQQFQVKTLPESLLYQRVVKPIDVAPAPIPPPATEIVSKHHLVSTLPRSGQVIHTPNPRSLFNQLSNQSSTLESCCAEITAAIEDKAYEHAIYKAKQLIAQEPQYFQAHYLIAQVYANLGDYLNAAQACHHALQLAPLAVEPLYILAHIAIEQGDIQAAKKLLRRIIYLVPTAAYAYFELGGLYKQEGNAEKAQRTWRSTLDLLKQLPPDADVEGQRGLKVAELQNCVERNLSV